ncbi:MAG: SDR family oxidoreductase [Steroidobacteraceae bacterium]
MVTGAGRGIGRALAERFVSAGAAVVLTDIDQTDVPAVADAVNRSGGRAVATRSDVTTAGEGERIAAFAIEQFGRLDILVNNAAVFTPMKLLDVNEENWNRTLDVWLKLLFFHSQAAARHMVAAGNGAGLINVASAAALVPATALAAYGAAKSGVMSLTRSFAKELGGQQITANAIVLGTTITPGFVAIREDIKAVLGVSEQQKWPVRAALGRQGETTDIANAAVLPRQRSRLGCHRYGSCRRRRLAVGLTARSNAIRRKHMASKLT